MDALLLVAAWVVGLASLYMIVDMIWSELVNRRVGRALTPLRAWPDRVRTERSRRP